MTYEQIYLLNYFSYFYIVFKIIAKQLYSISRNFLSCFLFKFYTSKWILFCVFSYHVLRSLFISSRKVV